MVIDSGGLGGNAGVTENIENYPGFPDGIGGRELMDRFIAQARRYDLELVNGARVESVQADDTEHGDLSVRLAAGQELAAHAVLVATGSTYRRLGIPGEDALIGAGVHFCATCDGPFYKGADEVLIVGGGNSALEEGLFLARFAPGANRPARARAESVAALLTIRSGLQSHSHLTRVEVNA